ncbi:head GIN domain-containing protein [Sphingomonas sp. GCM10030256]|uniref:head GIN domain-containing protein n=1 Tax=Sphingomonas sp. GCM10030256 TaxID=3273427 RepID=UPI00360F91EF
MRGFWIGTTVALALAACGQGKAEEAAEPGPAIQRSFPVGSFSKIEVAGPFHVEVTTGGQPAVSARGPSEALDKMVVEVVDGTLKIHPQRKKGMFRGWNWGDHKDTVQVAVAGPMLSRATIAGSGDMVVNRIAGERFQGTVAGSGNLNLPNVAVQQLGLEIAGSGNVTARGRAERVAYEIAGSGEIRAGEVLAEEAAAEIAGSGNIAAQATRTAKVDIAGSGNVQVSGGAKCSVSKAGSGNVTCS